MKLSILHLSDLHYRPNWQEEVGLVLSALLKDIKLQSPNHSNSFLIFSGDYVRAGGEPGSYCDLENQITSALDHAGYPRHKRLCVPGNHDISQPALKDSAFLQKAALDSTLTEQQFNERLPKLDASLFLPKLTNYKAFEERFAQFTTCPENVCGQGWKLAENVGVFCLNTALTSFGGLKDESGMPYIDQGNLRIGTRRLYDWIANYEFSTRILVMHHPIDWLTGWARTELERIVANNFKLVLSGHTHETSAKFIGTQIGGVVHCVAPPLFIGKAETLGYSFLNIDLEDRSLEVSYRQWCPITQSFVKGTVLAGNDLGVVFCRLGDSDPISFDVLPPHQPIQNTLAVLQAEFEEAKACYSSKSAIWVERDLSKTPETQTKDQGTIVKSVQQLSHNLSNYIVKAPKEFGLTCVGRQLALEHYRISGGVVLMLDLEEIPPHRQGVLECVASRMKQVAADPAMLVGLILDNWNVDKSATKILRIIREAYPNLKITILQGVDDCSQITEAIGIADLDAFETYFLWALSRSRVRELVSQYRSEDESLDDSVITQKVITDLDTLNIHRTPLNCLLILKLVEHEFDDSPVNRTEMLSRVLNILFFQFNKFPNYATRPDLKDCEYALGYFSEWLIRLGKNSFQKREFFEKVQTYCSTQMLELDVEVLFAFLVTENIFIRKGFEFEFRFTYWLYYFAAHRMHQDPVFADFIFQDRRYSSCPEMIEFYAGIDRRRSDAVTRLSDDLRKMSTGFSARSAIPADFNPLKELRWNPTEDVLEKLRNQVKEGMNESALPAEVKDRIADTDYNPAKPYNQALAKFIDESTLRTMIQAMKGAARVLRNSDHVSPELKMTLLAEVLNCWRRVSQILIILTPILADQRKANFEGMGFVLTDSFDRSDSASVRFNAILMSIVDNVVRWYQEDIFSKKMGVLLANHARKNEGGLDELFVLLLLIRQKPTGWQTLIEEFIVREHKNSFYLLKIFNALYVEYHEGFSPERTKYQLKRLTAMALAKHQIGVKRPNADLIKRASEALDIKSAEGSGKESVE